MTTRPGNGALGLHRNHRTKRLCNLVRVVRVDGVELLMTDHDRPITFEGRTYLPAIFAGVSAERREVGVRTPAQELHGVIDGTTMLVPDLLGQRYRGADVWHVVTDWMLPWYPIARHYKTIRAVRWNGHTFVATLDGRTQILERVSGGRFGGIMARECPYVYGDADTCKKDLAAETITGARVNTLTDNRFEFTFTSSSFPGVWTDDYFRDGEVEWKWKSPEYNGTTSTATTSTRVEEVGAGLTPNAHIGQEVRILSGVGGTTVVYATITGNDADGVDFDTDAAMAGYALGTSFDIVDTSNLKGFVSPIAKFTAATFTVELFAPTPFDITAGESAIVRAGCNGLFTTCESKANTLNFGGGHLQPQPGDQLEVAR